MFVSVIIPAYNRREYIARSLESVMAQTHADLEAIVVDDGSADGTGQVVEEYARRDSRVRLVIHRERKGAQAARNSGIRTARGQWIAFLDSDDYWLPDSLEVRIRRLSDGSPAIVHSDCYVLYPGNGEARRLNPRPVLGGAYKQLLRGQGPVFPSLLVPKEAFARINYLDESIVSYQEWDTAIRLARHYEFRFVPEPTFVYDCRHANTISKNARRTAIGYEQVVRKHSWAILRQLGPKALSLHYRSAAGYYRQTDDAAKARALLWTACLLWPFSGATLEALGDLVGEGPHREAWRWLRRQLRRSKTVFSDTPETDAPDRRLARDGRR